MSVQRDVMTLTCSVRGDGLQLDRQGEVGVLVVVQGVAVAPGAVKEPLPTEHGSVGEVQPQVLPHLTLLTLPAAGGERRRGSRERGNAAVLAGRLWFHVDATQGGLRTHYVLASNARA